MSELNVMRVNLRGIAASITYASQTAELNPQTAIQIMKMTKAFSERVSVAKYSRADSRSLSEAIAKICESQT